MTIEFQSLLLVCRSFYGTGIEIRKERPLLPEGILIAGREASVSEATGLCIQMQLDHPKSARR